MRLDQLAKEFSDSVQFLGVYIREAHAEGEDQVPRNLEEGVIIEQATNEDERAEAASTCMVRYNFSFPMLMDGMDNAAEENYQGWPDRLFLIDRDGKVAYRSGLGPLYFDVEEFEQEIRSHLDS